MIYPVLAFKQQGDSQLYGYESDRTLRHTSRELLQEGIFDGVLILDSTGKTYKLENVREVVTTNPFGGISLFRKGHRIIIEYDILLIKEQSLDEVRSFVLERLNSYKTESYFEELSQTVSRASSIEQIIFCFV